MHRAEPGCWRLLHLPLLLLATSLPLSLGTTAVVLLPPPGGLAASPIAEASAQCGLDEFGLPTFHTFCTGSGVCRPCGMDEFPASNVVDGDPTSSWLSPPLSAGEQFRRVSVDLDLGHLLAGTAIAVEGDVPLPVHWEVQVSVSGVEFTRLVSFVPSPDNCTDGVSASFQFDDTYYATLLSGEACVTGFSSVQFQILIPLRDGLVDSPVNDTQSLPVFRYVRINYIEPTTVHAPSGTMAQYYSISEFSAVGVCPDTTTTLRQVQAQITPFDDVRLLWKRDVFPRATIPDAWFLDNISLLPSGPSDDFSGGIDPLLWGNSTAFSGGRIEEQPCSAPDQGSVLYFDQLGLTQALSQSVNASELRFEIGFVEDSSEESEGSSVQLRLCPTNIDFDDCILLAIVTSGECGYCRDQLLTELALLIELLNTTLELTPPPIILLNETQLEQLRLDIARLQMEVRHFEGTIFVLEVAFGTEDQLPAGYNVSDSVERLDESLQPPVLEKLRMLEEEEDRFSQFTLDPSELRLLIDVVDELLSITVNESQLLQLEINATLMTLNDLLAQLRANLNETREARITSEAILSAISNRTFEEETALLALLEDDVVDALTIAALLYPMAVQTSVETNATVAAFEMLQPLLERALSLANEALSQTMLAQNFSDQAESDLEIFEQYLRDALDLNATITANLETVVLLLQYGEARLQMAREFINESRVLFNGLQQLVAELAAEVDAFRAGLGSYLNYRDCTLCTPGEVHAERLNNDSSTILSWSIYTYSRAYTLLANLDMGQLFNYSALLEIIYRGQNISQVALSRLLPLDVMAQRVSVTSTNNILTEVDRLFDTLIVVARNRSIEADRLAREFERQLNNFTTLERIAAELAQRTARLGERIGLADNATRLTMANQNYTDLNNASDIRLTLLEAESERLAAEINVTNENIAAAEDHLNQSESRFGTIELLLNTTRSTANQTIGDVTSFVMESNNLIDQIDSIIQRIEDTHQRINRINSPLRLESEPSTDRPYISLQPPPGRQLGDSIQFETIDIYLWPSREYGIPSLIFYAGPLYFPMEDMMGEMTVSAANRTEEDYILVNSESSGLSLRWRMGSHNGSIFLPNVRITTTSQIVIIRTGSKFSLLFNPPVRGNEETSIINSSLLFRTSSRTVFLLGGYPDGGELALPEFSRFRSLRGQFSLLLFNGRQWGLWNLRSSSDTNFIGDGTEFRRNPEAAVSLWKGLKSFINRANPLSFTGQNSYLFVSQFHDGTFNERIRGFNMQLRANLDTTGLLMYTYDTQMQLSLEVALLDQQLRIVIMRHNGSPNPVLADSTSTVSESILEDGIDDIEILFREGTGYRINGVIIRSSDAIFFDDLSRMKVWFGGVREDLLQAPYVPTVTNTSYFGCVDLFLTDLGTAFDVFIGSYFVEHYLLSSVQRGFSATCLETIYSSEVGLDGTNYLRYNYLKSFEIPNSDKLPLPDAEPGQIVFGGSFRSESDNGTMFAARGQLSSTQEIVIAIGLVNRRQLEVRVGLIENGVLVIALNGQARSERKIALRKWHSYLLEIKQTDTVSTIRLFLDGDLAAEEVGFSPLDSFSLPNVNTFDRMFGPVIFVGGTGFNGSRSFFDMGLFTGCLKDITSSFNAINLLSAAIPSDMRHLDGITYFSCPSTTVERIPALPVADPDPDQGFCFDSPLTAISSTHGSFHRDTGLFTSNVVRLLSSSWTLGFSLRYNGRDGHVITILSQLEHELSLVLIDGGDTVLVLTDPGGISEMLTFRTLTENVFTPVVIECTAASLLQCSLVINGERSNSTVQAPYSFHLFLPDVPLRLGSINGMDSFVGCIENLTLNGDPTGFSDVSTDSICYNRTTAGFGFTGASLITDTASVANGSRNVSFSFRPQRDNGLLLFLTERRVGDVNIPFDAVAAVGFYNGEVRVSNFAPSFQSLAMVCNNNVSRDYSLDVKYNTTSIAVSIDNGDFLVLGVNISAPENLVLTFGNMPEGYKVPIGSGQFSFLLNERDRLDSSPPSYWGCVDAIMRDGLPFELESAESFQRILHGLCPV